MKGTRTPSAVREPADLTLLSTNSVERGQLVSCHALLRIFQHCWQLRNKYRLGDTLLKFQISSSNNPDTDTAVSGALSVLSQLLRLPLAASIDFQPGRSQPGGRCGAGQKCIQCNYFWGCGPAGQKLTATASSFGTGRQKGSR